MKKRIAIIVSSVIALFFVSCITVFCIYPHTIIYAIAWMIGDGKIYETSSVSDYGVVKGNYDNDGAKEIIDSFFPSKIREEFSDVNYHYKAKKADGYGFEAWLEFTITDPDEYQKYLNAIVDRSECVPFPYDEMYMEYSLSNIFFISDAPPEYHGYAIEYAKLRKILFSEQKQQIIFFALGDHDGGGTSTGELSYFFDRFQIDPLEYSKNADDYPYPGEKEYIKPE